MGCVFSASIFFDNDESDEDSKEKATHSHRSPDSQFMHFATDFQGVVLEISYSQKKKDLKKLAWEYIQNSNGNFKIVLGVEVDYRKTKGATLSVWRPRFLREGGFNNLDVEQTIKSEVTEPSLTDHHEDNIDAT